MENVRKHRYIILASTDERRNFGVTTKLPYNKIFHRKYISKEMKKTQIMMNKSVYLRLSILHLILQL